MSDTNADKQVVEGFGDEWSRFDQSALSGSELEVLFENYFHIFPWTELPPDAVGFDLGCGSGRWAKLAATKVSRLHLIDPSSAIEVARKNLDTYTNCEFHQASVDDIPLADSSCDFGYSLGVLHHVPDTLAGLRSCVQKLKPGSPFLLYLYYRFDNRPAWFRFIWRVTDTGRRLISRLPHGPRYAVSQLIAAVVYFPLARLARLVDALGVRPDALPLSQYRDASFYTMRTDALDRFGTRLEKRFTQDEMRQLMENAGLERVIFSDRSFWTGLGYRTRTTAEK